jgi:hypothetical protein
MLCQDCRSSGLFRLASPQEKIDRFLKMPLADVVQFRWFQSDQDTMEAAKNNSAKELLGGKADIELPKLPGCDPVEQDLRDDLGNPMSASIVHDTSHVRKAD